MIVTVFVEMYNFLNFIIFSIPYLLTFSG